MPVWLNPIMTLWPLFRTAQDVRSWLASGTRQPKYATLLSLPAAAVTVPSGLGVRSAALPRGIVQCCCAGHHHQLHGGDHRPGQGGCGRAGGHAGLRQPLLVNAPSSLALPSLLVFEDKLMYSCALEFCSFGSYPVYQRFSTCTSCLLNVCTRCLEVSKPPGYMLMHALDDPSLPNGPDPPA